MSIGPDGGGYGLGELGGIYYAIVTQNDDKDGPGGRVKVRYPWLPDGDRDQSYWAPIAAPMMGDEFGAYVLPDVEDEVLVMFVAGDINQPIVIGGGWSQTDRPPETNQDGKNDFRLIKSRAHHRLVFDDSRHTKVVLSDLGDRHMVDVGAHGKAGASPNALDVPALGSERGVAVAALSGAVRVWCADGTLRIRARDVEVTARDAAHFRGENVALHGTSDATVASIGGGQFQGTPIKLGGG